MKYELAQENHTSQSRCRPQSDMGFEEALCRRDKYSFLLQRQGRCTAMQGLSAICSQ